MSDDPARDGLWGWTCPYCRRQERADTVDETYRLADEQIASAHDDIG